MATCRPVVSVIQGDDTFLKVSVLFSFVVCSFYRGISLLQSVTSVFHRQSGF